MAEGRQDFNPDDYQMSIGDHLEELRHRILLGLIGLVPAVLFCLLFGRQFLAFLCRPLTSALVRYDISPQVYTDELADGFMVYMKLSLIAAIAIAGPWIIYQLWKFISAGLYPRERHYVTKYIPLSVVLLFCGLLFVYCVVLPFSLQFFISFTSDLPLQMPLIHQAHTAGATTRATFVQAVSGNPGHPADFQMWFDTTQNRLKMFIGNKVRVIPFGPDNLVATHFTLPDYLDLVLQLLLTFGLAFQLPLVVMAVARIGLVQISTLKKWRRYVYLGLSMIAAGLAPGDVVTATVALLVPLVLLYELGIFLAKMGPKKPA
ncbi:MAG TPA: twin-arginine translocase subunit TatC [Tepidisphaeraceae bacterium]|jgi:sec-independent protein translocase protein TatC|nr:twin-arginine translocase subunit TatC [Tepidisphaeraceae bacterium]